MADNPIKVKAYGKILSFPAGTAPEAIESALAEHEHVLNPDYKAPQPEALDYAKGFASGANKLVSGAGFLMEAVGAKETGKAVRAFGDRGAKYWNDKMSKGGKLASQSQVFVDDDSEDSVTGIKLSDDWGKALLMGASQSLPSMFAAAIPGVAVTKGIQALAKLGLAGGAGATIPLLAGTAAPVGVTSNIIARVPSAVGFGAAEGVTAGAMNAADFKTSIEGMTDEELNKSPVYRALKEEHDPATARSLLAEQAAIDLFGKTAVSTGTIGALTGGGALGQAYQKVDTGTKSGILGTMLKGSASEALQETPQSGGEKYIENLTTQKFLDPDQSTTEGVLAAAASGGAIGAFTGGVVGAGGAINITPDRRAQVLNEKRKIAEMKADAVNARTMEESAADIGAAQDIDQALAAAMRATTKPVVSANEVLRSEDPTLADIENLTGLKPTEAIDTAIDEIENPIINQPQETENVSNQEERQAATTEATVLGDPDALKTDGKQSLGPATEIVGTEGVAGRTGTQANTKAAVKTVEDTSTSPVLKAEVLKAKGIKTPYDQYLKEHPNRKVAASVDLKNVEGTILKGLESTGKFDKKTRETYAAPFREFYKVNAERQGILPSELYERLPLKFSGKQEGRILNQEGKASPAARNKVNFDLKDATPDDFTPERVSELLNRNNWAILTAANPMGKSQSDAQNIRANEALKKELADRGLAYEVVQGRYPGDTKEMESYLVYGVDRKIANELGNKYKQDSVLTREGLIHSNGKATPVKSTGKGSSEGYTRVPRTGAKFAFDLDWSKEATAAEGALSLVGRHYSKEQRAALEGARFGQGYPGNERDRISESDDPRLKSRVDFYVDIGNGVTPESGLGSVVHETLLHNIYDGSTNPRKFKYPSDRLGGNVFEKQVLDAGYDGYYIVQGKQGRVVMLGDAAKSIPIEDNNEQRESELLAQSPGKDTGARESDGSLKGLPRQVGQFKAASFRKAQEVAKKYMKAAGLEYNPPTEYVKVNEARAKRIAQAFDEMKHEPQNPEVKAAYDALVKETTAQYKAVVDSGLKVEFIDFDKTGDPYEGSPRAMTEDVRSNNHMWVFSTRDGFGSSEFDPADNPLLAETEFEISGQKALVNDLFRVVHDYFGHVKEGVGFRAAGEENAWMAHMAMFSPLAGRALTTETRGQNSWVNYGPFAEHNRTASGADTKYADQKIGLLPEWASTEGRVERPTVNSEGKPIPNPEKFYEWFGDSKVVDKEGRPLTVYHGTTADFDIFDRGKANEESDLGGGLYFTNNVEDIKENYAGLGADLTLKIQLTAERIAADTDREYDDPDVMSEARAEYMAHEGFSMPVYVKLEKPVILGGPDETFFDYDTVYDEDLDEYGEPEGALIDVIEALRDQSYNFEDVDIEAIESNVAERGLDRGGLSASELIDIIKENSPYVTNPETGGVATSEFIRSSFESAGYDGFIDNTVNDKFGSNRKISKPMQGMDEGTVHYVAFDPTQVKSAIGNSGEFNPNDPNILKQSTFYSALEKEIGNLKKIANKNGEVSVDQAKAWINSRQKEGKFKQAEVEAVGLMDWLDTIEGKVPVTDVENFVRENGVRVEEVILEGEGESEIDDDQVYDEAYQDFIENYDGLDDSVYDDAILDTAREMLQDHSDERWGLLDLNGEDEVEDWLEGGEVDAGLIIEMLRNKSDPEEILGEDTYNAIRDEAEQYAWESNQDYYVDMARRRLGADNVTGGTEFGDYVLRGGDTEYKELLLTLPNVKAKFDAPHFDRAQDAGAENIFAHTRINEREMDAELTPEQVAEKEAYDAWVAGNNTPEIKQILKEKDEAGRDYRVALEKWKERMVKDTSISDKEYEQAINTLSSNPPEELKPFIARIDEVGAKVKALQEERLAVKPKEPSTSGAKEKVLFVEEIQSDWAQKGRDEGFRSEDFNRLTKETRKAKSAYESAAIEYRKEVEDSTGKDIAELKAIAQKLKDKWLELDNELAKADKGIPTAPFVTDTKAWTALVVKRLLRYAAENGFDRIAWTTGAQQAERYRLSKFVEKITASRSKDGKYYIRAEKEDGSSVIADYYEENKLAGTIGKELAEKIIKQPKGDHVYEGLDLDVGGQGMREFYDRIVPSVVNDVAKKLGGGKVETVSMGGQAGRVVKGLGGKILITYPNGSYLKNRNTGVMTESQDRADGFESVEEATRFLDRYEAQNLDEPGRQMSLRITPALKEKVMQGLPLFQRDRAGFNPRTFTISLMDGSDLSSVIHEGGHFYLEALAEMASQPNAPEQIVNDFDTTLQWFGIGEQVQETTDAATRTQGYPTTAGEPVATFRKADDMKAHPRYAEAKAGDDQAAFDLVSDLVTKENLNEASTRFAGATFVPVSMIDKNGANRIPTALAYHYANAAEGFVSDSIFESRKAYHTGMNAMERLVSRADFSGKVEPGRKYVLVDDVTTVGSTLADLASYIQENGGEVIGSVLLANATRSGNMFANVKTLKRLEAQYGNEIRELFNIEPSALTQEEAQYLIGFRNADELRSSAVKAQGSRLARIHARKISKGQSSVDRQRLRDIWQSMPLEQKRPYHEQWAQSFERYALEGKAPTEEMQSVFDRFKEWMLDVYESVKEFLKNNPLAGRLNNDVRQVFDRLIASEADIQRTAEARGTLKQSNKTAPEVEVDDELLAVGLADTKKAKSSLKYDMQQDAQGVIPGKPTYVNRALKKGDYTIDDMAEDWANTRSVLKDRYGDTVTLYRSDAPKGEHNADTQLVYFGDRKMAKKFATDGRKEVAVQIPVSDIVAMYVTPMDYYEFLVKKPGQFSQSGKKAPAPNTPASSTPPATPKKPFNSNEDIPETKFRKTQRLSQDAFNRFTVIQNWLKKKGVTLSEKADVYQAEERYHSLVANQLEDFREQKRNPLIEKIAKAGFTMADVSDFLEAQHAAEANAAIQKISNNDTDTAYGITDKEAADYLAKADPKLAKLANELRDITEESKQMRLKAGLLSQDEVDAWESTYEHYIPVKGDADAKGGTGKGLKVNFKTKRRLGHGKRDEAVIENIFLDHERAIMQVEKNRVAKHLVMMAAEMQMPEIMTVGQPVKRKTLRNTTAYEVKVSGVTRSVFNNKQAADMFKQLLPSLDKGVSPNDVTVEQTKDQRIVAMASPMLAENEINAYIDGHAIRVQINDDLLARAYAKLGVTGFSALVSAGRAFNGYLSKVYTGYNPEFILTNMIRDFTSGLINLTGEEGIKMAAKTSGNYVKSFSSLMRYAVSNGKKSDEWIDMYRANGGNTGAAYLSDLERLGDEVKTEYAAYQGVMANLKSGSFANASRAAGRKVFNLTLKWIYNLNQAGENAMRLAAFRAMIESGKTPAQAAKAAKNITVNFNRKGELGAEANAAYLFFNASVQGVAALAHAHFKGEHKYQAWGLSSMVGVLGYMAAAALLGGDDDEYDKLNDYTKSRNLLIKAGEGYAQIPIPYGYGFFWNMGRSIAEAQHKGELGNLPWHIAASAIEELTPFSDTVVGTQDGFHFDQVLLGLLPTVVKIPAQPAFNKQLFSGSELMPDSAFQQFQPDREKLWRATQGTMYDRMSGWLDEAIGADVSPETLKHYTRTFTGGAGAMVDTTVSAAMLKKEGAELEPSEIPFVRKAYSKLTIREHRAAYYKAREEAKKTAEEFTRAKARNDVTTINKLVKDEAEMIGLDAYANKLSKAISAMRDMQDAIRLDDNLNAAEKRTKIKELEITEQKFYDQYLDVFKIEKAKMKARSD